MPKNKDRKKKFSTKYRFVIIDDQTHESLFVFRGSKLSSILAISSCVILLCAAVFCLIAYTPIKQLLPGYPSYRTQEAAIDNAFKIDSLENEIRIYSLQLANIRRIVTGQEPLRIDSLIREGQIPQAETLAFNLKSRSDSLLREEVDSTERYNLTSTGRKTGQIESFMFFPPVKGVVTEGYSPATGHPFIDIAIPENSAVCATLDGTVIAAYWSDDTGYNIQIQHSNDLISVYRHNTRLLKGVGDRVTAGTTIAIAGDAGSVSTGPHLHFELWHKGVPIDPSLYVKF
ncbi:MAG TPA: M23 family metallopeptidase [Candidatus Coprenecus stercoripullorum]|nr:M23 family metallopeptidase [Candidatus Coprenecus stercoripullorum]